MPNLSLGRLRAILDLGEQLWFDPDALMCDPLRVRLRPPDQRLQSLLEVSGGSLVNAVVDLARLDQIVTLAPADIDAVPFLRQARSRRWSASRAARRFLHPVACTPLRIGTVSQLRDDTLQAEFAGVREHLAALDLEAFAELDVGTIDHLP